MVPFAPAGRARELSPERHSAFAESDAQYNRPGRTRCAAERGSAAGRPQLHLQPPVWEFSGLRPVWSLRVTSYPV